MDKINQISDTISNYNNGIDEVLGINGIARICGRPMKYLMKFGLFCNLSSSYINRKGCLVFRYHTLFDSKCPYYIYILLLANILMTFYLFLVGVAQFYSNRLYHTCRAHQIGLSFGDTDEAHRCVRGDDMKHVDQDASSLIQKMYFSLSILKWLDAPLSPGNDMAFIECYLLGSSIMIVMCIMILHWGSELSLSPIRFLYDPEAEFHYHQKTIEIITIELVGENTRRASGRRGSKTVCLCSLDNRKERYRLLDIINRWSLMRKVSPRSYSLRAYRFLIGFSFIYLIINWIQTFQPHSWRFAGQERESQANNTKASLECKEWHPNGIPIKDPLSFPQLKQLNYSLFNELELMSLSGPALFYKQGYGWFFHRRLFNVVNLISIPMMVIIRFQILFIRFYIFHTFMNRIFAINQLKERMRACIRMLKEYNRSELVSSSSEYRSVSLKIEAALTVTLINFRFLLNDDKYYHSIFDQSSTIGCLILFILTPLMNITDENMTPLSDRFLQILSQSMIVVSNLQILVPLFIINSYRSLFQFNNIIVGHLTLIDLHDSLIGRKWRQMMLYDSQVQGTFSMTFLGTKLDEKNIMSLNTSFVGALIWVLARDHYRGNSVLQIFNS